MTWHRDLLWWARQMQHRQNIYSLLVLKFRLPHRWFDLLWRCPFDYDCSVTQAMAREYQQPCGFGLPYRPRA